MKFSVETCEKAQEALPLLWSSELSRKDAARLQQHMELCEQCAHEAERQQKMDARLRTACLTDSPDPASLRLRVQNRLRTIQTSWWQRMLAGELRSVSFAAAALVCTLLLIMSGSTGYFLRSTTSALAAASGRDHTRCVVNHEHDDWHIEPADVSSFFMTHLGSANPIDYQALGLHLVRTRICNLAGPRFVHMVLADEQKREVSLYLRRSPEPLIAGPLLGADHKPALHQDHFASFQIASFEIGGKTVLLLAPWTADRASFVTGKIRAQLS